MKNFKRFSTFFSAFFLAEFAYDILVAHSESEFLFLLPTVTIVAIIGGVIFTIRLSKKNIIASANSDLAREDKPVETEFSQEFSPTPQNQSWLIILSGLFVFDYFFLWLDKDFTLPKQISYTLLLVILAIYSFLSVRKSRLIFTDTGIELHGLGKKINAAWNSIAEIFKRRNGNESILLKTATIRTYFGTKNISNYEISLSDFEDSWQTGKIGSIIRECAPYLEFFKTIETNEIEPSEADIQNDEQWSAIRKALRRDK